MLRPLAPLALSLLALTSSACSGQTPESRWPLRVLSSDVPALAEPEPARPAVTRDTTAPEAPRIGAPGGSGAGSRRVVPVQSGKDTVGGLPAGNGGGTGPAGRG